MALLYVADFRFISFPEEIYHSRGEGETEKGRFCLKSKIYLLLAPEEY